MPGLPVIFTNNAGSDASRTTPGFFQKTTSPVKYQANMLKYIL
jgi:hypothetical protein